MQIKRSEPTVQHLQSDPACCPYCVQENFGAVYTPPPWRAGLGSEGSVRVISLHVLSKEPCPLEVDMFIPFTARLPCIPARQPPISPKAPGALFPCHLQCVLAEPYISNAHVHSPCRRGQIWPRVALRLRPRARPANRSAARASARTIPK